MSEEIYFKRGARIKTERRIQLTEAVVSYERASPPPQAYAFAMAHIHKSWARRWLKSKGYFL